MDRIMRAYFEEGRDIGDVEELVRLASRDRPAERERAPHWCCARAGRHGRRRASRDGARHHRGSRLSSSTASTRCPARRRWRPSCASSIRSAELAAGREVASVNAGELTGRSARTSSPICRSALRAARARGHALLEFAPRRAGGRLRSVPVSSFPRFRPPAQDLERKVQRRAADAGCVGTALDAARCRRRERVAAILRGRRCPGASRHHWGTDVDLIDRNATGPGISSAAHARGIHAPAGPVRPLAEWLEAHAARFGFFRPFRGVLSGVQPEPWHFSFAPVAENARRA
jgi:hypothetical protein